MNKIFAALGVNDFKTYLEKYFLPIFLMDFFVLFLFLFAFDNGFAKILGFVVFFGILFLIFSYPLILLDNQSRNIEENLHYFITYAGALGTVNLERKDMFRDLSEKVRYREIAKAFKKLLYLVESIKIDFSTSAYKTSSLYKSEHFARFLERMGIAMSFNSQLTSFFLTEQKVLMDSYSIIYKEGLERIKVVQEMFTSLSLAFAFVLATVLLMPFLTGIEATLFLKFGIFIILLMDIIVVVFAKFFLPVDNLYSTLGMDDGRKKVIMVFFVALFISLIIAPFIIFLDLPMILRMAIVATPFLFVGLYSNYQEKLVWKRDVLFPPFIRSLGDVHQSKGGTLTTTVETLMPHDFGILNEMLIRVYKRLKITKDKFNSWYYFTRESGSALIAEFMDIFITVVYRGGSAEIAGKIVSDNMTRINGLRDIKKEYTSSLKGNVYGSYFGFAITIYISLLISVLLMGVFSSMIGGADGMAGDIIGGIFPGDFSGGEAESANYVAFILFIHASLSAFFMKEIDGGNYFSFFSDAVIMLWMGVAIEFMITATFKTMFSGYFS